MTGLARMKGAARETLPPAPPPLSPPGPRRLFWGNGGRARVNEAAGRPPAGEGTAAGR